MISTSSVHYFVQECCSVLPGIWFSLYTGLHLICQSRVFFLFYFIYSYIYFYLLLCISQCYYKIQYCLIAHCYMKQLALCCTQLSIFYLKPICNQMAFKNIHIYLLPHYLLLTLHFLFSPEQFHSNVVDQLHYFTAVCASHREHFVSWPRVYVGDYNPFLQINLINFQK